MKIGYIAWSFYEDYERGDPGEFFTTEPPDWYAKSIQIVYSEIDR